VYKEEAQERAKEMKQAAEAEAEAKRVATQRFSATIEN